MEEFGEVYKLVADGPYCELHLLAPSPQERAGGEVKVVTKTLKAILCQFEHKRARECETYQRSCREPPNYLRLNRKIAVNQKYIRSLSGANVTLTTGETFKFSRNRFKQFNSMKNKSLSFILGLILLSFLSSVAQTNTSVEAKKVVKIGNKFFIESTVTTKTYTELTTDIILDVDRDEATDASDAQEIALKQAERDKKKSERQERNKLLKEAMQKGYKPEVSTLEEQEKVNKIKTKIGIK